MSEPGKAPSLKYPPSKSAPYVYLAAGAFASSTAAMAAATGQWPIFAAFMGLTAWYVARLWAWSRLG